MERLEIYVLVSSVTLFSIQGESSAAIMSFYIIIVRFGRCFS